MASDDAPFSVASFVRELALAWQKLSIYQPGHPARAAAVERAHALLAGLVAPTGSLAFGVSRDAIVAPEGKLAAGPAAKLAAALYRRGAAVVRFQEGIDSGELAALLELLPKHPSYEEEAPLWDELAGRGVRHVEVEPLDLSRLVLTEEIDTPPAARRGESLWDRILVRLLSDERLAGGAGGPGAAGPASLAEVLSLIRGLLERYGVAPGEGPAAPAAGAAAGDVLASLAALVGDAVGGHIETSSDPESRRSAARHAAELLTAIPEALREPVLDAAVRALATGEAPPEGLDSLAATVSAAQLVGSLRRLRGEGLSFSPRALALVETLAAEALPAQIPGAADPEALTAELRKVFGDADVDRVQPGREAYDRLFLRLHRAPPGPPPASRDLQQRLDSLGEHRLLMQTASTLLELLGRPLVGAAETAAIAGRLEGVFRSLLESGRIASALRIVEALQALAASPDRPARAREGAEACLAGLNRLETITAVVDSLGELTPGARRRLHELIDLLGPDLIRQMLLALGEEENLSRRRQIFDLLASLGSVVVPHATALLADPRWYVTRNMLSLLRQAGQGIPPPVLRTGLQHADPRVRLEAVKCLPALAGGVPGRLIEQLLADADPLVAEATVAAVGRHRLAAGLGPLLALLRRPDPMGRHRALRLKALAALGELGDPAALTELRSFFRRWLAVSSEERRAAYASLEHYPPEARKPWVKKGLRSLDPEIRAICGRLKGGPGSPPEAAPAAGQAPRGEG